MKSLKIVIALIVVSLIGYAAYTYIGPIADSLTTPEEVPSDALTEQTKAKIDSIRNLSPNQFCVDYYNEILGDIVYYANEGKIDSRNKDQLLKDLEFEYHELFVLQANYVFKNNQWSQNDMNIIKNERNRLSNSNYIDVKTELNSIKTVLDEYNELMRFISEANNFSNQTEEIIYINQRFDSVETASYINNARERMRRTDITKNCSRINGSLNEIPNKLYQKHLRYLNNKVDFANDMYLKYKDFTAYNNSIYVPLYAEIVYFRNSYNLYGIDTYAQSKADSDGILSKLNEQRRNATKNLPTP